MAVLNRDDFLKAIQGTIGDDTSEESVTFLEDMTETYDHMAKQANGDGEDWKAKYEQNDKSWREKYTHRFFSGGNPNFNPQSHGHEQDENDDDPENITVDDLFK